MVALCYSLNTNHYEFGQILLYSRLIHDESFIVCLFLYMYIDQYLDDIEVVQR